MIRAIAIDDEPLALRVIESYCRKVAFIELLQTFTKPSEALMVLENTEVDLIFLDIEMPNILGTDFYNSLSSKPLVIFTTAYSEYAVAGFNLNAVDFLLKPFNFDRFAQAAEKAQNMANMTQPSDLDKANYIYVKSDYSLIKIAVDQIDYLEGLDDYLKIHLQDKKPVVTRMTMKSMTELLRPYQFLRIHRSYIVPSSKIERIKNKQVQIGDIMLPISKSYEEEVMQMFTKEG
jgi:DNA-binding LytR/AlgR family response regulator